ncbi:hypothetical protein Kpol_1023p6 [Vanderwaltozyma polyspora DSM 70294]|uniref:Uncharacterized protein n=1 Tax=Vanderwaltozyma polyspora (strain ATCC 22028 / DSM 70294 / BCRC 21397 / CBS 2163 / NBRC 10782 / NRRL Y-8283 / UCD 57-17) TaxID=436907 RepID=A7TFM9_VANPO|nr:uncharacterized protein Kpol_1023p6 [Vanderwaltozyma polyspora DSM 70294]EDO18837.1 hypothetical protein Kpol_1023p6 [Vanderwaltozyma polyspora DSM 70294]
MDDTSLNPATPPRSRGVSKMSTEMIYEDSYIETSSEDISFSTPRKPSQMAAPVTPSTTKQFKHVPLLAPPSITKNSNKGLKSPAYTPNRRSSITTKRSLPLVELPEVDSKTLRSHQSNNLIFNDHNNVFLSNNRKNLFNKLAVEEDEQFEREVKSMKTVPGTPSHKITTFEMARQWHDERYLEDQSDDDNEILISKNSSVNPFFSDSIPTQEELYSRKQTLISENPDIENSITYLNKKGEVIEKRMLTPEEKDRFKPKRLFAEELDKLRDEDKN